MRYFLRNVSEYAFLFGLWMAEHQFIARQPLGPSWLVGIVLLAAWGKSIFFGVENLQELWHATRRNVPYYRFMLIMLVNMSQMVTSFALDYHCLQSLNAESFGSISSEFTSGELLFECFYFSVLNFTFFGYGDITPQTIPAKLLTMTEVILAFVTVIFLLSDFISLKESLIRKDECPPESSGGRADSQAK